MAKVHVCFCLALVAVFYFTSYSLVSAVSVKYQSCQGAKLFGKVINTTTTNDIRCEILNVSVDPCPLAKSGGCKHTIGSKASITFYYKPKFDGTKLSTAGKFSLGRITLLMTNKIPDPLYENVDGCPFTKCPIKSGETYKFHREFTIHPWYKPGAQWASWGFANEKDEECCFILTGLELVK